MTRRTLLLCASALLISGGGAAASSDDDDTCGCAPGQLCNKVCDGFNRECAPDVIDCPAGSPCHISCAGFNGLRQQACWGKTIRCARGFPCIVTCTGKDACRGLQIESGGSGLAGGGPNVELQCETPNVCNDYKQGQSYSCEHITIDGRKQSLVEMLRGLSDDGGCKPAWKGLGVKVESTTGNATELFGFFEAGLEGLFPEGETKVMVRVLCTVEDVTGYKTGRCFVRGSEPVEVFNGILEGSPVVYLDSEVRTESAVMAATVGRIQEALRYRSVRRGPLARLRAASAAGGGANASAPGREAAVLAGGGGDDDATADALAFPAPLSFDDGSYVAVTQQGGDPAGAAGAYSPRTVETFAEMRGISPGAPSTMADPPEEDSSAAVIVVTAMATLCCVALIGGVLVIRGKRSATTGKARRSNVVPEAKAGEMLGQQNMQFLLAAEEAEMNLNAFYQQEMGQIVDGSPLSPTLSNRGGVEGSKDDCCSRSSSGASIAMICHTLSQNTPPREFSPAHYPPRRAHHRIGHHSPGGIGR